MALTAILSVSGHRLLQLVSDSETYANGALNCAFNEVVWIDRLAPPPSPPETSYGRSRQKKSNVLKPHIGHRNSCIRRTPLSGMWRSAGLVRTDVSMEKSLPSSG
jgi:hypothetical protein